MNAPVVYILIAVGLYWMYCIFSGQKQTPRPTTAVDYFIANRGIPPQWYILAATATSFSGWTFISHPGLIFSDGFQASLISFYAITIAFSGVLFLKRQWLLGQRYQFVTPGDMFSTYYQSAEYLREGKPIPRFDGLKILISVVALLFSLLYVAVQLRASGYLIGKLTGFSEENAEKLIMVILAMFLLGYVLPKGIRRVAYIDQLQFLLLLTGMIGLGIIVLVQVGGWEQLKTGMTYLTDFDYQRAPHTENYSHYFAVPGSIQSNVWDFKCDTQNDGWTGMMLLTFMLALMGIQTSPAFTMWAFSNQHPKAFAHQQVIASSLVVGFVMLIFTTLQGIGPHFLGANPEFAKAYPEQVTLEKTIVEPLPVKQIECQKKEGTKEIKEVLETDRLIPNLILSIQKLDWSKLDWWSTVAPNLLIALLAIAALAALQSTAASYISTFGSIITRDFARGFLSEPGNDHTQIKLARWFGVGIVVMALILAILFKGSAIALLGGLAVACGLQMLPALWGICWWPFLTRKGIFWGIWVGLLVVFLTDNPNNLFSGFGIDWRYPLTIHSAGWGLFANILVALLISLLTQDLQERSHRMRYHKFLRTYDSLPESKKTAGFIGWLLVILWFTFAIGPGVILGNDFFGNPNEPPSWWFFGILPIWAWQAVWWVFGVGMMAFLAYYLKFSTLSDQELEDFRRQEQISPPSK